MNAVNENLTHDERNVSRSSLNQTEENVFKHAGSSVWSII